MDPSSLPAPLYRRSTSPPQASTHATYWIPVLLTPQVLEFTSETFKPAPCKRRDLSCFFEDFAPQCDELEYRTAERKAEQDALKE